MGIPDEASWFKRSQLRTGTATGWRRTGCVLMLVAAFLLVVTAALLAQLD